MTLEEFVARLLALGAVVIAAASVALVAALACLALVAVRLVRVPRLIAYDVVIPARQAPAAELLFTLVHALFAQDRAGLTWLRAPIVVCAHGSADGLRLRVAAIDRDAGRLSATLATIWPNAQLVATRVTPTGHAAALEWRPRAAHVPHASTVPGSELTLPRALAHVEAGEELSFELVLRPSGAPRRHAPIWDLRPAPAAARSDADKQITRTRDVPHAGALDCVVVARAHASTRSRAESLVREFEPTVHLLCAGSGVSVGGARRGGHYRPRLGDPGALGPSDLATLFPLVSIAAAVAATSVPTFGERLLGVRRVGPREMEVRVSLPASRQHLHVLGPTGTGKSTLLLNLVAQDIAAGRGCAVLDPKGDLIRDLLARIPARRVDDVVYLGPDEGARAVGINPLELGPTEDAHLAAENVLSIFKRIYAENWGPRTDDVLKACLITLVAVPGATVAHIPALLGDAALRRRLTALVADDLGVGGFWTWYEKLSEPRRIEATAPLQNKLRDFLVRPRLRHLLCQRSTVDLRRLMDEGGILFADLGVGRWGENASALAGSFVVSRLWQAALAREAQPEEQRRDFLLYIDEFQSFLGIGGPFADALAQARGMRVSLTVANQHLGQLPREIRDALSANARSRVVFRCAAAEAASLAADLAPLDAESLIGLRPFEAAVRLPAMAHATTIGTLPPAARPADAAEATDVLAASSRRFGRDVASIDKALRELLTSSDEAHETSRQRTA